MPVLFREDNIISLRTAFITKNEGRVYFGLPPANWISLDSQGTSDALAMDRYATWLYRELRSPLEENKLLRAWPQILDQDLKPMCFEKGPEFKLLWTDSGNSVAVCLNGIPWAFVDQETEQAYSKGILNREAGNLWNQQLFDRIFDEK
jgi:hypothetical protein